MKIYLIFSLLSLNIAFCQTNYFELQTLNISDIQVVEAKFKSNRVIEFKTSFYEKNVELAMEFEREKNGNFPAARVTYLSAPKDSRVESIVFYWKLNINRKKPQLEKIKKYNTEFDKLILAITSELGNSLPGQGNVEKVESFISDDPTPNYERKVIWKKNNRVITATIIWAENHGEQMITLIE